MIAPHLLPRGMFADLAEGGGGPDAIGRLASTQRSKNLLLLRSITREALARGHPHAGFTRRSYETLAEIQKVAPAAVEAVIRYPLTGSWAACTLRALLRGDARARPERLAALAAGAIVIGRVPRIVPLIAEAGSVCLPSLGRAVFPGLADRSQVTLRLSSAGAELVTGSLRVRIPRDPHTDRGNWQGLRRLSAEGGPLVDDVDPWRFPGHPDLAGRLTARELRPWNERLAEGLRVLSSYHPAVAAEVAEAISVVVPLDQPERGSRSGTSRTAFGCVAMSLPPDGHAAAVTLVHELQHSKLAALTDLFELTRDEDNHEFPAPWRSDLRPIGALLQGAYTHLAIADFWERQRHIERDPAAAAYAQLQFAHWGRATLGVTRLLHGRDEVTPLGKHFVSGMLRAMAGWRFDRAHGNAIEARDACSARY